MNATLSTTLTRLAQSMESLRPAGAEPAWAEIIGPPDNPEHVRWHPDIESMVGFLAPPSVGSVAAVGYGWAHGLEGEPPEAVEILAPGERRRVRIVCLMTRSGDMAGYLRDDTSVLIREPPTIGRVLDCMRRCFGLPTPPPEDPTDVLLAAMWLNEVLGMARERGAAPPPGWLDVARRHPVIKVATDGGVPIPPAQFRRIMRVGAEVWTWSYLLTQAASTTWVDELLPPGAVAWMDEGIFSRWLLASLGPVDRLLEEVTLLIDPTAATKLRSTLKHLGVLGAHPRTRTASNK